MYVCTYIFQLFDHSGQDGQEKSLDIVPQRSTSNFSQARPGSRNLHHLSRHELITGSSEMSATCAYKRCPRIAQLFISPIPPTKSSVFHYEPFYDFDRFLEDALSTQGAAPGDSTITRRAAAGKRGEGMIRAFKPK